MITAGIGRRRTEGATDFGRPWGGPANLVMPASTVQMRAVRGDCDDESGDRLLPVQPTRKGNGLMDRMRWMRLVLGVLAVGVAVVLLPATAFAQEVERTLITSNGAGWLGGAL